MSEPGLVVGERCKELVLFLVELRLARDSDAADAVGGDFLRVYLGGLPSP